MKSLFFFLGVVLWGGLFGQLELPKFGNSDTIVCHRGFTLCYNSKFKQANWVAYLLTRPEASPSKGKRVDRTDNFCADPFIPGSDLRFDYLKSGYDRGHLAPAADMGFSRETMLESFYYSNMSPQVPRFNRGVWKKLEEQVRKWAVEYDSLYVVTGPIFRDSMTFIGGNRVAVPKAYFKVLLQKRYGYWTATAFILPNASSRLGFKNYVVTIDKVERLTGLDFFWRLDDAVEIEVENSLGGF